jgi:hypothetical protein
MGFLCQFFEPPQSQSFQCDTVMTQWVLTEQRRKWR